jgi:hypothetical protein
VCAETTESAQPGTELAAAPEESLALADAEGGFIEVTGAEALRSEFERLLFDKHLSPDQVLGLWESNEAARAAIERRFGAEALNAAAERLAAMQAARGHPRAAGRAAEPQQQEATANPAGTTADSAMLARSGRRRRRHAPAIDSDLLVTIDPGWGDQRVFRYYRACLATVQNNGAGEGSDIARFRAANRAIETRLRQKLPGLMQQIDAFYPEPGGRP